MNKLMSLILAALLLCCVVPAVAEEAAPEWNFDYITAIDGNQECVRVQIGSLYGLYRVDGTPICEPCYRYLNPIAGTSGCFVAANDSGLNTLMVINQAGEPITEAAYGHIEPISGDWLLCVVLSSVEGDDYDYTSWLNSDERYIVERYDLVYVPEGRIVGSLTREQYDEASDFGSYVIVQDDSEGVTVYNTAFEALQTTMTSPWDCPFTIVDEAIVNRITGQTIAAGYTSVYLQDNELLQVRAKRRAYGLMDHQGNLVLDTDFDYISYNAILDLYKLEQDNLMGIYDAEINTFIPCAYSNVLGKSRVGDTTYYCVELDGRVGYINAAGEVTCPIAYSKNAVTILGASMFAADLDGTIKLIAADGIITPMPNVTEVYGYEDVTQGYYVRVKNAQNNWGVMDWHGQLVFDFSSYSASSIHFVTPTHFVFEGESVHGLN